MAAVAFTPLRVWAGNRLEVGFPDGLFLWILLNAAVASIAWKIATMLGADPDGMTYTLFWFFLAIGSLGSMSDNVPGGSLALLGGTLLFGGASYRLRGFKPFVLFANWACLLAVLIPIGILATDALPADRSTVIDGAPMGVSSFEDSPDVVVVVFDGYGSHETLERWYGVDADVAVADLERKGLHVKRSMTANYPITSLSLASFFDMTYPLVSGDRMEQLEWAALMEKVRGNNQLVKTFKMRGYRFWMIESGWSGVQCTRHVDRCVNNRWPTYATSEAIDRSLLRGFQFGIFSYASASGALNTIDWLTEDLPGLTSNFDKDLIIAHLLVPHPPFFLNGDCEYRWSPFLGGTAVGTPEMTVGFLQNRRAAYVEQVRCIDAVLADVASKVSRNTLIVAFGDHGPDSRGQLFKAPESWDEGDVSERMGIFFATNSYGCELTDVASLVNVGRRLLECLSGQPLELLPDRRFLTTTSRRSIDADPEPLLEIETGGPLVVHPAWLKGK